MASKSSKPSPVATDRTSAAYCAARAASSRFSGREEPDLQDLMTDPIFQSLMDSDGVRHEHLMAMIADLRIRLAD